VVLVHADAVSRKGHDSFENEVALLRVFYQHKVPRGGPARLQSTRSEYGMRRS
jgi:hypothetical protein